MDELDELKIQWGKMKAGYANLTEAERIKLKEQVLSCFGSDEMRGYLAGNFEELSSWDLIDIIVGAQKPLEFKLDLFSELARFFPHPFDELDPYYDFEPYVESYKMSFEDMKNHMNETAVYLLFQYNYHETEATETAQWIPFLSFSAAMQYIESNMEDWLQYSYDGESVEDALTWFELEKWVGDDRTSLKATYTISKYGEIWDYSQEQSGLYHTFGISNALGLNLPVPFIAGDVIAIDCRPFAPIKYAVIVTVGDNHDCCSVQCLYARNDGTLAIGALKHTDVFDVGFKPDISPLYNIQKVKEPLPADEVYLSDIGEIIARWDSEWRQKKDFNAYEDSVYNRVWRMLRDGDVKDEFLAMIRKESSDISKGL